MGYKEFVVNRLLSAMFVLFAASVLIFSILRMIPGDPARIMLGEDATPEAVQAQRDRLGLDVPIHEQYIGWVGDILTLSMGESIMTGVPIEAMLAIRYPRSLSLAFAAIGIALMIAVPFGVIAATKENSIADYAALFFSQLGISIPNFVLGIFLILIFAAQLNVLPSTGYVSPFESFPEYIRHLVMPAVTMGIINGAILTRFVRSEMLEQLNNDYVRTARAFGHPEDRIIRRFTLRNALIPMITVTGIQFAGLVGGLVVIEQVFSYPGMGVLILDALFNRDYPVLQIGLLLIAATFIIVNLVVDMIYGYLDPRVKH